MDEEELSAEGELGEEGGSAGDIDTLKPAALPNLAEPYYAVRPDFDQRFQSLNVKDIIYQTLMEILYGRIYEKDKVSKMIQQIGNTITMRIIQLNMKRYKTVVNVILIEMKGAGVKSAMRCVWDPETDNYVSETFRNDSMFCHVTVYGVYLY